MPLTPRAVSAVSPVRAVSAVRAVNAQCHCPYGSQDKCQFCINQLLLAVWTDRLESPVDAAVLMTVLLRRVD